MKITRENSIENVTVNPWKTRLADYSIAIRPVAAIVVINLVDFSTVAANDEEAGLKLLAQSRRLQKYYGEKFKATRMVEMGASTLISFHSAEQAVKCALKMQRSARTMFHQQLSVGIHMGEVNYVEDDVLGMTVNIASDIQEMSSPGQILVSESIARCLTEVNSGNGMHMSEYDNQPMRVFEIKRSQDLTVQTWSISKKQHLPTGQKAHGLKVASGF